MNRISFTLPDVGLREIKGLAYVEDDYLVLRVENALLGLIDQEAEVVKIEPSALQSVEHRRGIFRDRLVLRPKQPTLLDVIPGDHVTSVELRVPRKERPILEALLDEYAALR